MEYSIFKSKTFYFNQKRSQFAQKQLFQSIFFSIIQIMNCNGI